MLVCGKLCAKLSGWFPLRQLCSLSALSSLLLSSPTLPLTVSRSGNNDAQLSSDRCLSCAPDCSSLPLWLAQNDASNRLPHRPAGSSANRRSSALLTDKLTNTSSAHSQLTQLNPMRATIKKKPPNDASLSLANYSSQLSDNLPISLSLSLASSYPLPSAAPSSSVCVSLSRSFARLLDNSFRPRPINFCTSPLRSLIARPFAPLPLCLFAALYDERPLGWCQRVNSPLFSPRQVVEKKQPLGLLLWIDPLDKQAPLPLSLSLFFFLLPKGKTRFHFQHQVFASSRALIGLLS